MSFAMNALVQEACEDLSLTGRGEAVEGKLATSDLLGGVGVLMATGKVFQNLVPSTKKEKFPAVMGSELSVNNIYMESLDGGRVA